MSTPTSSSSPEPSSESSRSPTPDAPSGRAEASAVAGSVPGERAAAVDERGGGGGARVATSLGSPAAAGMLPASAGFVGLCCMPLASARSSCCCSAAAVQRRAVDPYECVISRSATPATDRGSAAVAADGGESCARILFGPRVRQQALLVSTSLAPVCRWGPGRIFTLSLAGFAAWQRRRWGVSGAAFAGYDAAVLHERSAGKSGALPFGADLGGVGLAMLVSSAWLAPVGRAGRLVARGGGLVVEGSPADPRGRACRREPWRWPWLPRDGGGAAEAEPRGAAAAGSVALGAGLWALCPAVGPAGSSSTARRVPGTGLESKPPCACRSRPLHW